MRKKLFDEFQKGTKNEYERSRTFGTMFADLNFRNKLLDAHNEEDFKKLVAEEAKALGDRHNESRMKMSDGDKEEETKVNDKITFASVTVWALNRGLDSIVPCYRLL